MRYFIQVFLFVLYITCSFQPIKSQEDCLDVSASICDGGLPGKRGAVGHPGPSGPAGPKGEQGKDSHKITELETEIAELRDVAARNISELQSQLATLQTYIDAQRLGRYMISLTPRKGTYDEARVMCIAKGGDLLQKCLSRRVNGVTYEHQIAAYVGLNLSGLWIGISDREEEGSWKYLDGEDFNGQESDGEDLLYYWDSGQPQYADDCGGIHPYYVRLHDWGCDFVFYGICEIPEA